VQVFFVERNAIFELPVARGSSEVVEVVQVDKVIETRIASLRLSDSCEIRQRHRYSNYDKICDDNEFEFNSIKSQYSHALCVVRRSLLSSHRAREMMMRK
jgi:hypothetical protein